ncbi:MAG: NTP transferase domain-containing protein [Desulfurococcales archaeon]|nr:NTP transferase domain-containing protein [Desulfurococcales archaeon]
MPLNVLIMAGGESSRLGGFYKPLMKTCNGRSILDKLVEVGREATGGNVFVAISMPNTIALGKINADMFIVTGGRGFCFDLSDALSRVDFPILVIPGDLPLLTARVIREFLSEAMAKPWDVVSLEIPYGCNGLEGKEGFTGIGLFKKDNFSSYGSIEMCSYPDLLDVDSFSDYKKVLGEC